MKNFKSKTLTIKGPMPPSKKNSKDIFVNSKTGKRFVTSSKKYKEWEQDMLWSLKSCKTKFTDIQEIYIVFYPTNKYKSDLTNKAESIMDLLVKADIIEDDNWFEIPSLYLKMVDGETVPKIEITFYYLENDNEG